MSKRKLVSDEGPLSIPLDFPSLILVRTQRVQASPRPVLSNEHRSRHKLEPLCPNQRERERILRAQMPPHQKNAAPSSKSHVRRTFWNVSRGSCHRGETNDLDVPFSSRLTMSDSTWLTGNVKAMSHVRNSKFLGQQGMFVWIDY
jgi:hypothetical protein